LSAINLEEFSDIAIRFHKYEAIACCGRFFGRVAGEINPT